MTIQDADYIRDFYEILESRVSKFNPLIQVLCGPRQIGKTTATKSLLEKYKNKSIYVNLDNPGTNPLERIRFEWDRALRIKGHKIIAFDEIQNVSGWAKLLKELYDQERSKKEISVVVLGSSALELLLRGEESLLGRFEIIRAPHWSYYETNSAFAWDITKYLQFGGYPILAELFQKDSFERCQSYVRDAILESVITRDIFSLQSVVNTSVFRQVLKIAFSLPCEEISFAKLLGQLSEKGSSATVKNYLELLEKAFLIKLLYRYSKGVVRQRTSSPKIVPLAPALIHAYIDPRRVLDDASWYGHVFESAVISKFVDTGYELSYWSNSREDVDLVIDTGKVICAIEIKSGNSYDMRGLNAFKAKYKSAKTIFMDRKLGEEFLLAQDARKFLAQLV
ncbi:MAG: ATP-binding protein [Proteobacteria bacterium]|nr:ATP-binding protein [Pseudomonadota bacterium]